MGKFIVSNKFGEFFSGFGYGGKMIWSPMINDARELEREEQFTTIKNWGPHMEPKMEYL